MRYLYSPSNDPRWNLALEEYVFERLDRTQDYFLLWQNGNAIIVGKYQNTAGEIDAAYVKEHDIQVVRRLSGGGAVYHDLGNLNFTFIADQTGSTVDFSTFCRPVIQALERLGVEAKLSGRNDMTVEGKKFSGNSMYVKEGRVMHHGTLLFDSDLQVLSRALTVSGEKLQSKGVASVRSRVTNLKPYLGERLTVADFAAALRREMDRMDPLEGYILTAKDLSEIQTLRDRRYATWEWNYGASPPYQVVKRRRVEGCGTLEVHFDVVQGTIREVAFYGDFFGDGDHGELAAILRGCPLTQDGLETALKTVAVSRYFRGLEQKELIEVFLS